MVYASDGMLLKVFYLYSISKNKQSIQIQGNGVQNVSKWKEGEKKELRFKSFSSIRLVAHNNRKQAPEG